MNKKIIILIMLSFSIHTMELTGDINYIQLDSINTIDIEKDEDKKEKITHINFKLINDINFQCKTIRDNLYGKGSASELIITVNTNKGVFLKKIANSYYDGFGIVVTSDKVINLKKNNYISITLKDLDKEEINSVNVSVQDVNQEGLEYMQGGCKTNKRIKSDFFL